MVCVNDWTALVLVRSTMDGSWKRVFSVAFGVINSVLSKSRERARCRDEDDEEFMVVVSQFAAM